MLDLISPTIHSLVQSQIDDIIYALFYIFMWLSKYKLNHQSSDIPSSSSSTPSTPSTSFSSSPNFLHIPQVAQQISIMFSKALPFLFTFYDSPDICCRSAIFYVIQFDHNYANVWSSLLHYLFFITLLSLPFLLSGSLPMGQIPFISWPPSPALLSDVPSCSQNTPALTRQRPRPPFVDWRLCPRHRLGWTLR